MAVSPGSKVLAGEYNSVAELVNKIFGDNYSTASVNDPDRSNHKYGWGALNLADNLTLTDRIMADKLQFMVDRTNVMVDRTNITDTILVFNVPNARTDILAQTPIRAEDLNVIENKINSSIIANGTHLTVDPTDASALSVTPTNGPYETADSFVWHNSLNAEHKWVFNDYNHARYFFNSGGQLRLSTAMEGGSTAGYYNWADILNEIGLLSFTHDNTFQSSSDVTIGTSEGKGFYQLTDRYGDGSDVDGIVDEEGLLFTSSGVTISGYGYGYASGIYIIDGAFVDEAAYTAYSSGYGAYSGYANRYLKVYGKHANNGSEVHFKIVMDDTAFDQYTDGKVSVALSYLMPDIMIRGSATFDVSPDPTAEITNNFNTADDS